MTPQERIKADAWSIAESKCGEEVTPYRSGYFYGYIAGATAEHDRAQVLVDALELIEANSELPGIKSFATTSLEQWKSGKGKETKVYRPCPHCGKELFRDRNLCCRACGKEVGDGLP